MTRHIVQWSPVRAHRVAVLAAATDGGVSPSAEARTEAGWLAVYEIDRAYGGPEEGGWWFDTGRLVACVPAERWTLWTVTGNGGGHRKARDLYTFDDDDGEPRPRFTGPLADSAAAEAMVAACLARYGDDAFDRCVDSVTYDGGALSLEWREDAPEAYYPEARPEYA